MPLLGRVGQSYRRAARDTRDIDHVFVELPTPVIRPR